MCSCRNPRALPDVQFFGSFLLCWPFSFARKNIPPGSILLLHTKDSEFPNLCWKLNSRFTLSMMSLPSFVTRAPEDNFEFCKTNYNLNFELNITSSRHCPQSRYFSFGPQYLQKKHNPILHGVENVYFREKNLWRLWSVSPLKTSEIINDKRSQRSTWSTAFLPELFVPMCEFPSAAR